MDVKDLFKDILKYENKDVTLEGWVRNNRNQSNFGFIDFNDGTYFQSLQLVYEKELKDFESISKIRVGSAIRVNGTIVKSEGSGQSHEMKVKDLTMSPVYKDLNRLHVALVTPPIKKTNLILKNANFQHAMTLWNFLQEEMEDKTEHKKGNEVIKDDEKTKKMLNETFLLNYFILNSFNNDGDIINDDEKIKKNKQVLINQFVQKMVLANEELNFDELGDMVNKEIQLVKEQTLATEKEIKIIFEATIDEYIESINNLKLGDENNENKDK